MSDKTYSTETRMASVVRSPENSSIGYKQVSKIAVNDCESMLRYIEDDECCTSY